MTTIIEQNKSLAVLPPEAVAAVRGSSRVRDFCAMEKERKIEKGGPTMALRDLIPWNNGSRDVSSYHNQGNPLLAMHREMNRLFDEAFRAFDIGTFGSQAMSWPSVEVNETDKEVKVVAELPGLEEKDVAVELANGVLTISGEKKSETEDQGASLQRALLWPLRAPHPDR